MEAIRVKLVSDKTEQVNDELTPQVEKLLNSTEKEFKRLAAALKSKGEDTEIRKEVAQIVRSMGSLRESLKAS